MTSRGRQATESTLVPLADRLRYMQVLRILVTLAAGLCWLALPMTRGLTAVQLGAMTAGYLLLSLPAGSVWRLHRRLAVTLSGLIMLCDGLYLAVISYLTAGMGAPLQYLVLVHLVAVTLLASFRTGLKVAIWHSMLVGIAYQLQSASIIHLQLPAWSSTDQAAVPLFLALIWVVTLATASFAALNERELRRRNSDLHSLTQLSQRLELTDTAEGVAQELVNAISADFEIARLVVLAAPTGDLEFLAGRGLATPSTEVTPGEDKLVRTSMRERATMRVTRFRPSDDPWLCSALPDALNIVAFPLFAEGTALGVVTIEYGRGSGARIERRLIGIIERFVSQAGLALSNAWLLSQVKALAATDALTGLANRRTFDARLEQEFTRAARAGQPLALAMIDVDHFKHVNDEYGHAVGDQVLQRIATVLTGTSRLYDVAARYGGEEFAMILPGADLAAGMAIAERARAAIEALEREPRVTASIGVACFPANVVDMQSLSQAADESLYISKRSGRNVVTGSQRSVSDLDVLDASLQISMG